MRLGGVHTDAAIYCRLSKEDEEKSGESESIQNQKSLLCGYAAEKGWNVYNIYCDEDFSGVDRERPAFNQLIQDAEQRKFTIVLCKTQSRFTRDMELVEHYLHSLFPLWGIRFIAVVDNIDTSVKGNKKARQINGLINEWYLEDLSENIKAVFDVKRKNGEYIGSFPVYGYQKDPQNHNRLLIDEAAAEVVRSIFSLYISGLGKQQIAARLNEQGLPNPTLYKQQAGMAYCSAFGKSGSGLWSKTTVGRILKNEMYTGTLVQGRKRKISYKHKQCADVPKDQWVRVPGTHNAVIDENLFLAVQSQLQKHTRSCGGGEKHALSGLVHCMDCGGALCKTSCKYNGVQHAYLRCGLYASKSSACSSHSVRLDVLTELIEDKICTYLRTLCPEELISLVPDDAEKSKINFQTKLSAIQRQIELRRTAMKNLYLDRAAGILTSGQFTDYSETFEGEIQEFEVQQQKLVCEQNALPDRAQQEQKVLNLLQFRTVPKALIHLLVKDIEVAQKDAGAAEQRIRIHWHF